MFESVSSVDVLVAVEINHDDLFLVAVYSVHQSVRLCYAADV